MFFDINKRQLAQSNQQAYIVQKSLENSVHTGENFYGPRLSSVAEDLQRTMGILKPTSAAKDQAIYLNVLLDNYTYQDWLIANQEFALLYEYLTEYTQPKAVQTEPNQQNLLAQAQIIVDQTNAKLQQELNNLMIQAQNLFTSERIQQWFQLQQQLAYVDLMHQVSIIIERQNHLLQEQKAINELLADPLISSQERKILLQRQQEVAKQMRALAPALQIANEIAQKYQTQGATFDINDHKKYFAQLKTAANSVRQNLANDEENLQNLKQTAPQAFEKLGQIHQEFKDKIDEIDADFSSQKQEINEKIEALGDVPQEIAQEMLKAVQTIDNILNFPKDLLGNLNDEQRQSLQILKDAMQNKYIPQIAAASSVTAVNDILQQCRAEIQTQIQQANLSNLADNAKTREIIESLKIITDRIDGVIPSLTIAEMPSIRPIVANIELPIAIPVMNPINAAEARFVSLREQYQQTRATAEAMVEENNVEIEAEIPVVEATVIDKQLTGINDEVYKEIQSLVENVNAFLAELQTADPEMYQQLSSSLSTFSQTLSADEMCQEDYDALTELISQAAEKYPENEIIAYLNENIDIINELNPSGLKLN